MKRGLRVMPLLAFLVIALLLLWQLARNAGGEDPTDLESALTGQRLPVLRLPSLEDPQRYYVTGEVTGGKPVLLNVWATWCPTCQAEHQFLNQLAARGVRVVGLNYKDDRHKALGWLNRLGNPYVLNVSDASGMLGLELGVYGAPETFLVDGEGIIRYRHAGEITASIWAQTLKPLWDKYNTGAGQ